MKRKISAALPIPSFRIPPSPWPVDPHAPGYLDCPQPMYGFNCAGEIRRTGWWPPMYFPVYTPQTFPLDSNAPKGKKPVFIPLPDSFSSLKWIHADRLPFIRQDIETWRRAVDRAAEESRGFKAANIPYEMYLGVNRIIKESAFKALALNNPLDDPASVWSKAFARYTSPLAQPEPSTPDDIPADLFTRNPGSDLDFNPFGPGWQDRADRIFSAIEQQLNDDDMKKKTKKERIAILEQKMEMLRESVQDYTNATCRMQERLEEFVAKEIDQSLRLRFDIMPSSLRPAEGITHYGRYDGSPVLTWIADGKWWIQEANFSPEQPAFIEKLIWFKNTGTDK